MRHGTIGCSCGQRFYFETHREKIACISCNKEHDLSDFPEKKEIKETEENETEEDDL